MMLRNAIQSRLDMNGPNYSRGYESFLTLPAYFASEQMVERVQSFDVRWSLATMSRSRIDIMVGRWRERAHVQFPRFPVRVLRRILPSFCFPCDDPQHSERNPTFLLGCVQCETVQPLPSSYPVSNGVYFSEAEAQTIFFNKQ